MEAREQRVLVIDDYPDTIDIITTMVSFLGHVALGVRSAAEALAAVKHFQPDVVILDLELPDSTGRELARRLREGCTKRPHVIALTGWTVREAQRRNLIDREIDEVVLKPAGLATFRDVLDRVADAEHRRARSPCIRERARVFHAV